MPTYLKINENIYIESYFYKPFNKTNFDIIKEFIYSPEYKNLSISNNLIHDDYILNNKIQLLPNINNSDLIILRKTNPYFENDILKCQFKNSCEIRNDLKEKILKSNYMIIYQDNHLILFKKN